MNVVELALCMRAQHATSRRPDRGDEIPRRRRLGRMVSATPPLAAPRWSAIAIEAWEIGCDREVGRCSILTKGRRSAAARNSMVPGESYRTEPLG
jgi:hypothetical protein